MKHAFILFTVMFLLGCDGDSGDAEQSKTTASSEPTSEAVQNISKTAQQPEVKATEFQTLKVNTDGVDLSFFASDDNICSIISKAELLELFTVAGEMTTEPEKSGAATCRYSWQYESLAARKKATETGETFQFPNESKYNARAISNEARLLISVAPSQKPAADFVPEILTEAEIEATVEDDSARLINEMAQSNQLSDTESEAITSRLGSMAEKRKQTMIKRNQQNTAVKAVGDAAYWAHIGGGGLHVLVGDMHVYISPLIATNTAADVNNAIRVLAKIVE